MTNYRKIMELLLAGRSYRDVVEIVGCSHRDVAAVKRVISAEGITAESAAELSGEQLAGFFPDGRRRVAAEYDQPDYARVLAAMKANRHHTLLLAWRRYADASGAGKKYGYSQFCALFAGYMRRNDLVATLHHVPGRAMHVDWAGDTLALVDQLTGEAAKAYLWVGVLPYSGVLFCRGYLNMKTEAWLDAHMRAFSLFEGVTQIVIPDNPTTSTHQRRKGDAERVVNARYQQFADHYQTAIVPARAKSPRDKAAAEAAVKVVNTRVIGFLEDQSWHSLAELNEAIAERVAEINHDMPRADDSTRWGRFAAEEQYLLGPLPDARFEEADWREAKVGRNYHITTDYQHYSVPWKLAGQSVRVRLTTTRVTIFDGLEIVCEHPRLRGRKGQYSTLAEHVSEKHRTIDRLWSRRWFTDRAASFGPATVAIIEQILDRHAIEAQGYLDCQNILAGLGKKNSARLEAACQELVNRDGYATYTTIKRIMATIDTDQKKPRPVRAAASTTKPARPSGAGADVYVRDASHYQSAGGH